MINKNSIEQKKAKQAADLLNREFEALHNALRKQESKPNVLTIAQFNKYSVFYRHPDHEIDAGEAVDLRKLSDEYIHLIDPYKQTHIVDAQGTVVLRLPQLFAPIRDADPTPENVQARAISTKFNTSGTVTPGEQDRAFDILAKSILREQGKGVTAIRAAQLETVELVREFHRRQKTGVQPAVQPTNVEIKQEVVSPMPDPDQAYTFD